MDQTRIPFAQIKEITGIDDHATIVNTWNNCAAKGGTSEAITADVIACLIGTATAVGPPTAAADEVHISRFYWLIFCRNRQQATN